ncbi:MAG: hypothetical protein Q4G34_10915 [Micrococcus sp.]|nr:hypothetical protein [Micrococcus sp.]
MAWWSTGLLLAIPGVWLGLLIGISLIEAPLKFTAPGITLPLGLGIGRRVFFAMNLVEAVLAVVVVMAAGRALGVPWQSRAERSGAARWIWPSVLGAVALLAIKTAVIRPFLNRRTDAVLAGLDAGGSSWHYAYVAVDGLLILLMIALLVFTVRTFAAPRA